MIRNLMEQVVEEILPLVLKEYIDMCKCQNCIDDIKALTLNNLNPMYCSTEICAIVSRLKISEVQNNTDILSEITKAIEIVSKNVRHDSLQE